MVLVEFRDIEQLHLALMAFLLLMARFSGFFMISPFLSRKAMPRIVRLGIIAIPSLICTPVVAESLHPMDGLAARYILLAVKELMLGYVIGMLTWLPVHGLELAGAIFDTQTGSTQAQDFDSLFGSQITQTAILLSQIFSCYFFSAGGFLIILTLLFDSINLWPPAESLPVISKNAPFLLIRFAAATFFTAIAFTVPICGFTLLVDIAIALLARTTPSLNALTFSPQVKTVIVLLMLGAYLEAAYPKIIDALSENLTLTSRVMAP